MLYDVVVIGGGFGGYSAAIKAAKGGLKTVIIEQNDLGGTCLNRGCIPTKVLLHSAQFYHEAKTASEIGIDFTELTYNLNKMHENKKNIVTKLKQGIAALIKSNKVDLLVGCGTILSRDKVSVLMENETTTLETKNIIIATGSVPAKPPIAGIDSDGVYTSDELLEDNKQFKDIVIIGGGVIGVEFASVYNYLGMDVTIIEYADRIVPLLDKEVSQNLLMILKKRGVKIHTSAKLSKIEKDNALKCTFVLKEQENTVNSEAVLVSTGRRAFTEKLFGDGFSVKLNCGMIVVDEHFCTSQPNIYAIGDVIGGAMLAHAASAQGVLVVEHILGEELSINIATIPSCVYTNPEIASVGVSETDAKTKGLNIKVGKFSMNSNGKSIINRQERGFIKIIFAADTKKVLGATLMCGRASDLISELTLAIVSELTVKEMLKAIHSHPTFAEGVGEAVENAFGSEIH